MRNPADTTDSSSTFHEAELNVPPVTTGTNKQISLYLLLHYNL